MERRFPWLWIALAGLLILAPGPVSRLLLDVIGGLTLTILVLPFLLAGGGWLTWRLLRSRVRSCPSCGLSTLATEVCPACGSSLAAPAGTVSVMWEPFASSQAGSPLGSALFGLRAERSSDLSESLPIQDCETPASDVTIDIQARQVGEENGKEDSGC
jgi:hypothetical protein